jgi:hypothetical protein
MKTIKFNSLIFTAFVVLFTLFTGCKKDYEASKATYLPDIKIKGDAVVVVLIDAPYTELGAVATENGSPIDFVITGTVDVSTPGVYSLEYLATNSDGFSASDTRTVVVIPGPVTNDVSYIEGKYVTSPNGGTPATTFSNITKIKPGVYYTENCWGNGSLAVLPAYFWCLDGVTLEIPTQGEGAGQVVTAGAPGVYDTNLSKILWTITRPLFPGGPLTRNKSWTKV